MSAQWGIFNDESADWTEEEAIEAGFYSREEAERAVAERYSGDGDDDIVVHLVEWPDDDEDDDEDEDEDEDEDDYPAKH